MVPHGLEGFADGQLEDVGGDGDADRHKHQEVHGPAPPALLALDAEEHPGDAHLGEGETPRERGLAEEEPLFGEHLLIGREVVVVPSDAIADGN